MQILDSCAELKLRLDGFELVANSRNLAAVAQKRHDHVLRDIDIILRSRPDLNGTWFRSVSYLDANGQLRPAYDVTRDGFKLLTERWTGIRLLNLKVDGLRAFTALEAEQHSSPPATEPNETRYPERIIKGDRLSVLAITDLHLFANEPKVQDLRLAEILGFERPRDIRELIKRNAEELENLGGLFHRIKNVNDYDGLPYDTANLQSLGGRPATEYWLNEEQALLLCMFARTVKARSARREIIRVFLAWRHGHLTPTTPTLNEIIDVIDERLDAKFIPIYEWLRQLEPPIKSTSSEVNYIHDYVKDIIPKRQDFQPRDIERWRRACYEYFSGRCPCCHRTKILDEAGTLIDGVCEKDHFNGRDKIGVDDGWLVCRPCNSRLRNTTFKQTKRCAFDTFHGLRRDEEAEAAVPVEPSTVMALTLPIKLPTKKSLPRYNRPRRYHSDDVITVLVNDNPKRPGSRTYDRFSRYGGQKGATITVRAAIRAGVNRNDLYWDERHGFITITPDQLPDRPDPTA